MLKVQFDAFKQQFAKSYESPELEAYRFEVFKENLQTVVELNAAEGQSEPVYGVTQFMDLTAQEFKGRYMGYKPKWGQAAVDRLSWPVHTAARKAPRLDSFDWRTKNAITKVKNQGDCGSCWAFSAVSEMESCWFLGGHTLTELSPQQVVSCDTKGQDKGCDGGDTVTAYVYMKGAGSQSEASYPYTSGDTGLDGPCKYNAAKVVARMVNWTYAVPPCFDACKHQDEEVLATNLAATAPASICVYAETWQFYSGGILSKNCQESYTALDHCVQLVGFNTNAAGVRYWIVRNSWGTSWGEQGYINIKMGSNLCGLADEATFIQV